MYEHKTLERKLDEINQRFIHHMYHQTTAQIEISSYQVSAILSLTLLEDALKLQETAWRKLRIL